MFAKEMQENGLAFRQDSNRRTRYNGFGTTAYNVATAEQEGLCVICEKQGMQLVIDHDHDDGVVRALLCPNCNCGFGWLGENTTYMKDAIEYLINANN